MIWVPRALLSLALTIAAGTPAQADTVDALAKKLVALRSDVEALQAELDELKSAHTARMRSLAAQRSELEVSQRREELKVKRLKRGLANAREQARRAGAYDDELRPVLEQALAATRSYIKTSLPFQAPERLVELKEIETQYRTQVLPGSKALARLWAFYEDEIRLASENGMHRQVVNVGNEEFLADVIRLGMVMLFFRTDTDVGYAVSESGRWTYRTATSSADQAQIRTLFESFDKQIRTGYFELPNALVAEVPQ